MVSAAVGDIDGEDAARLLDVLVGANLVEEYSGDRYRFHDLIRLHAQTTLAQDETSESRRAAFARLVDYYLATAVAADLTISSRRGRRGSYFERQPQVAFTDSTAAITWLESELANFVALLRAAQQVGLHELVWQICEALWGVFILRKHYGAWLTSYELGLASARACADPKAQALMLESLAFAHLNLLDYSAALQCSTEALQLEQSAGHRFGEGAALERIGVAQLGMHNFEAAIDAFDRARAIYEDLNQDRGIALMTRRLGEAFGRIGRYTEALEHLTRARQVFVDLEERYHEARTLSTMAEVHIGAGRPDAGEQALAKALAITSEIGAIHEQANIHVALARLAKQSDEPVVDRSHLERALTLYRNLDAPQADEVDDYLAGRISRLGPDDTDPRQ
jgi:tetratricopeptide (TPR) repeat protein